jgi:hypothetical protein
LRASHIVQVKPSPKEAGDQLNMILAWTALSIETVA